jgi:RNA polymerase sigma factor (sigma-70 family)
MLDECHNEIVKRAKAELSALAPSDHKLITFTHLWSQHQVSIRAYLSSFLGNSIAVDDSLQEVALVVWQKGPWEKSPEDFMGYCLACAKRIAFSARRKEFDPRMEFLSPEVATALADHVALREQERPINNDARVITLRNCLQKIKPEHRDLLDCRYSGESKDELRAFSKRVGKSMDALYKTLERLRESLRDCMERDQHPPL